MSQSLALWSSNDKLRFWSVNWGYPSKQQTLPRPETLVWGESRKGLVWRPLELYIDLSFIFNHHTNANTPTIVPSISKEISACRWSMSRNYIFAIQITCAHGVSPNSILAIAHAMVSLLFAQCFCNLMKSSWPASKGMCNNKKMAQAAGEKLQTCPGFAERGFDMFWCSKSSRAALFIGPVFLQLSAFFLIFMADINGVSIIVCFKTDAHGGSHHVAWSSQHGQWSVGFPSVSHTDRGLNMFPHTWGFWGRKAQAKKSHSAGVKSEQHQDPIVWDMAPLVPAHACLIWQYN